MLLLIGVTFLASVWVAYSDTGIFKFADRYVYDQFIRLTRQAPSADRITIVDIDETSLSALGQWPWPRYRLAELIGAISELSPSAMAIDVVLPEADRTSPAAIKEQFKRDFNIDLGFRNAPAQIMDFDAYLGFTLGQKGMVGSRYFYFDHSGQSSDCNWDPVEITGLVDELELHNATGILCNTFKIEKAFKRTGFNNNRYDSDGLMRRIPLLIRYKNGIFTHLSLSTLMEDLNIERLAVEKNACGLYLRAGDYTIPITRDGYTYLRFNGPAQSFPYLSAVDLVNGTAAPERIKDRIVFIGSSAVGLFDIHQTMFDSHFPGVESHAVFIDSVLKNNQIVSPDWSRHALFAACLTLGWAMVAMLAFSARPLVFGLGTAVSGLFILCLSFGLFKFRQIFLPAGTPLLLGALEFSIISFTRFISARNAALMWFKKLSATQQVSMETLVNIVETRDPETGQHIKRTQHYARTLALELKRDSIYSGQITSGFVEMLFLAVPLHDIGKVGIPDRILLKPGKLNDDEFELMKLHAPYGKYAIDKSARRLKEDNYLEMGAQIAGCHHERWDGKGYPEGLSGNDIPLAGRIMSICDVYDALISRRCYKEPFSHEKAMSIIGKGKGSQFDPYITESFFSIQEDIRLIASTYRDEIEHAPDALKDIFMAPADEEK